MQVYRICAFVAFISVITAYSHAGVNGNERADRLAGSVITTEGWPMDHAAIINALRDIGRIKDFGAKTPDLVFDFLSVFAGNWNNRAEVDAGLTPTLLEARFRQVNIPSIPRKTLVYFENAINGSVFSLFLCEVTKDKIRDNSVNMIPYRFTNRKYRAGEYNLDDLSNITANDLKGYEECIVSFQTSGDGVFTGLCAQCNYSKNQPHPQCTLTFSCDNYTLVRPESEVTPARPLRNVFLLNGGPRYPLINAPKNYVSPCNKKNRESIRDTQS